MGDCDHRVITEFQNYHRNGEREYRPPFEPQISDGVAGISSKICVDFEPICRSISWGLSPVRVVRRRGDSRCFDDVVMDRSWSL
eukprot:scaffold68_cov340-Pavlova_lutheri.AAC.34